MALNLTELDATTREHMLREFDVETDSDLPYLPASLTDHGKRQWPTLMRLAIADGDDTSLMSALCADPAIFVERETYVLNGMRRERAVNPRQAAERLATSEFNTWYVRGLSARLLAENVDRVEIYRAGEARRSPAECSAHEGLIVEVRDVYAGHRAKYWPTPSQSAFSVPFQPMCHHSIRRLEG